MDIEEEYRFAVDELEQQVDIQILEDGTQFEQSILYHVEVYKALLEMCILLPDKKSHFLSLLEKMAIYIKVMTGLDGRSLAFGDSDCHETQDILSLSAIVLDNQQLLANQTPKLDIIMLLFIGKEGIKKLKTLDIRETKYAKAIFFENSGQVCLRSPNVHFFFKNGPIGSAHTHSDENSFCLQYQGKPIFVDAGRYSYREIAERYYLKSSWAHTGCILDGTSPEKISGSWIYEAYPQCLSCDYKGVGEHHYMEGSYLAWLGNQPYIYKRRIVVVAELLWLVVDELVCQGEHELLTQFILDNQIRASSQQVDKLSLFSKVPLELEETIISKRYNEIEKSKKLVKRQRFSNSILDYTLIADQSLAVTKHTVYQTDGNPLTDSLAFECKNEQIDKIILVSTGDVYKGEKLFLIDDVKMRGKCVIYDKGKRAMIRLKH